MMIHGDVSERLLAVAEVTMLLLQHAAAKAKEKGEQGPGETEPKGDL